jgi:hypothetical protein
MQNVTPQHRRNHFASVQAITINFAARRPTGAEIRPSLFSADNSNGRRKHGVERALKFLRGKPGLCSETAHLTQRVNSRIGAACGVKRNVFLRQAAENADDFSLHGWLPRLNLPAVIIGAIVSNRKLDIAHAE